ncbi:hypothetical protein U1Q18_030063 [Sarracenia purpurea var. burkii]
MSLKPKTPNTIASSRGPVPVSGRDLLDVIVVDEQKDEHSDESEGGGLLDVYEDGAEGEAEVLGDEDVEEEENKTKDEGGRGGFEVVHPVGDDDEEGGRTSSIGRSPTVRAK